MVQLLITTEVDMYAIRDSVDGGGALIFDFECAEVSEMEFGWLLILNDKDDYDDIELAIEAIDDVQVIGSYDEDGTQIVWGNPTVNADRKHTNAKYHAILKPKQLYDEEGEPDGTIPYTFEEAKVKQVNSILGWVARDIDDGTT